jgi:hypothetical protein
MGTRGSVVVEALCYKSEGREFDTRWDECIVPVYLIRPAGPVPGGYSASNRNEYQEKKTLGLSPLASYTDRATAACRRS